MDEYGKTVSMSEAIAEWSAETDLEALRAAADKLDWSGFGDHGVKRSRALLALAELYADWLITTTFGRDVVESCISIERQSGYVSRNSGRSFGMLAGEIALQQAEADLDSLFFDSGDFEERFLRGVADYDVENALREI